MSFNLLKSLFSLFTLCMLVGIFLPSCKSTKYLNEDQSLVKGVEIKINAKNGEQIDELKTELNYFVLQQKNKTLGLIPISREYIYYKHNDANDSSSYDKWMREKIGQEPVLHDSTKTISSAVSMENYLRFKKGYYHAKVDYSIVNRNKKTFVTYIVDLDHRFKVKSIEYISTDKQIIAQIEKTKNQSLIKPGMGLDGDQFQLEKARIANELQNNGYADFAVNYIDIKGDSTGGNHLVDVIMEIYPPANKAAHLQYKVGQVKVFTDYYNKQDTTGMNYVFLDGIGYFTEQPQFIVKPEVLQKAIYLKSGNLVKRNDRVATYDKLSSLGTYRFAEIVSKINSSDSTLIDFDINLTPHISKWISDYGFDIFNSTLTRTDPNIAGRKFIGLGVSSSLENRNFLGGSEKLILNADLSTQIELGGQSSSPIRALTFGMGSNIAYPVFKDPFKIVSSMKSIGLLTNKLYKDISNDATSNLGLNLNLINFRDLYSINTVDATFGYRFTDRISKSLRIDQINISLNKYILTPRWDTLTGNNIYLKQSFKDNFFTSILFNSLNYTVNYNKNRKGIAGAFLINLEFSGIEVMLLNSLFANNTTWKLGTFEFSKYGKIELDGRITKFYSGKKSLVGRLNVGLISPLTKSQSSPYIKQFSVGGPNSLRGWGLRSLGPGATIPANLDEIPYSQGDIKLEANLEYRFNIWWILDGALFMDAGNVWAIKSSTAGDPGIFSSGFMQQLAVAGGWGMRWDFNYFKIRFDFGYKIRQPYAIANRYWYSWDQIKSQKLGNLQVAINYPF